METPAEAEKSMESKQEGLSLVSEWEGGVQRSEDVLESVCLYSSGVQDVWTDIPSELISEYFFWILK